MRSATATVRDTKVKICCPRKHAELFWDGGLSNPHRKRGHRRQRRSVVGRGSRSHYYAPPNLCSEFANRRLGPPTRFLAIRHTGNAAHTPPHLHFASTPQIEPSIVASTQKSPQVTTTAHSTPYARSNRESGNGDTAEYTRHSAVAATPAASSRRG